MKKSIQRIAALSSIFFLSITAYAQTADSLLEVINENDSWTIKDLSKGTTVASSLPYDEVDDFVHGAARIRSGKKWGFINTSGKEIIAPKYDFVYDYDEDMADVMNNGKYGFIDKSGKEIIPLKYTAAHSFHEGLAAVAINDKWGFINKAGKEVVALQYENQHDFHNGYVEVMKDHKHGMIDINGKLIIPLKYDAVFEQEQTKLIIARSGGNYQIYNKETKKIGSAKYTDVHDEVSEGMILVTLKTKKGYIDVTGREVIKPSFDVAGNFENGKAEVEKNGETFFIDKSGKKIK